MSASNQHDHRRGAGRLAGGLRGLREARGGQVAVIFALLLPVIALLIAGVIDASFALDGRTQLQDATDAAALAVAASVAEDPNATVAALKTIAENTLAVDYRGAPPTITDFHVCAPVQNDCTDGATTLANGSVKLATTASAPCTMASLAPAFCATGSSQTVGADTVASINLGRTVQLNIVMDASASMIVGATPADVDAISAWVSGHWSLVKPLDPLQNGDNPPCAFACHDIDGATQPLDVATGLTNAHKARVTLANGKVVPATTRFEVMTAAAGDLINHVQAVGGNPRNLKNTYLFNIFSFDKTLLQHGAQDISTYAAANAAVSQVSPGLDTYLNDALTQLVTKVGSNGNGTAKAPLKFVVLVTDGLQSDRGANWNGPSTYDAKWNFAPTYESGFGAPLDSTICQTMKSNGVILAVLETPYVPLDGQDPHVQPYEKTVRHTIYPGGPKTPSVVSAAMSDCASPGYYYQAVNSSDISTGFQSLTDQFLARSATIVQ